MTLNKHMILIMQVAMLAIASTGVFAEDVSVVGSIKHKIKRSSSEYKSSRDIKTDKIIQLLRVQLSEEAKRDLLGQVKDVLEHTRQFSMIPPQPETAVLPKQVELGMNDVPVLDQGIHGTCVTFAVTGAIDAVMEKGDYVSQLCHLQLGNYLEAHGYSSSGWNGSHAVDVIHQIEQFGVIDIKKQTELGCGGMKYYPTRSSYYPNSFIEPKEYTSRSEFIFGKVASWSEVYKKNEAANTLKEVKESLRAGDRVVFAVLIPRTDLGRVGAVGKYKTWIYKDTWLLTPDILQGLANIEAAHEMIITGYNDNAVAVDNRGVKHKGLLSLRNSWGTSVGDDGEFYMSYDYFKLLSYDAQRVSKYGV